MSAGLFLIIFFVATVVVIRLISNAAKRPTPTGFRVDPADQHPSWRQRGVTSQGPAGEGPQSGALRGEILHGQEDNSNHPSQGLQERSLNCWFQYNGHTWDAYEALGVPGGADKQTCRRAFERIMKEDRDHEFYRVAWAALDSLRKWGN